MRRAALAVGAALVGVYAVWYRYANPSDRVRAKRYRHRMGFDRPFEVRAREARASWDKRP